MPVAEIAWRVYRIRGPRLRPGHPIPGLLGSNVGKS
jgi:hypothetical protein